MNHAKMNIQQILNEFPDVQNLGELLKKLEEKYALNGEVVCQFIVNDLVLSEVDEQRIADAPIDEVKSIAIQTESPAALLFGLLDNWISELPVLVQSTDELAKDIRFAGIEGRLKKFIDLIDSCQFLIESLMNLESILARESMSVENWKKNKVLTARAIGDALHAFEKKDFVQLSEVLEYDLGNSLQQWSDEIVRMRDYLKQENDKDSQQFAARIFEKREVGSTVATDSTAGSSEHTP